MKAGHATPGTNIALSDCLCGKTCRLPPLHFNVHSDSSRGVNTTICTLASFSFRLNASAHLCNRRKSCQSMQVLYMDVSVCVNTICKYGHISYPCHLSTFIFSICQPGHECEPVSYLSAPHLLAHLLVQLYSLATHKQSRQ